MSALSDDLSERLTDLVCLLESDGEGLGDAEFVAVLDDADATLLELYRAIIRELHPASGVTRESVTLPPRTANATLTAADSAVLRDYGVQRPMRNRKTGALTRKSATPEPPRPGGRYRQQGADWFTICVNGSCRKIDDPGLLKWLRGEL